VPAPEGHNPQCPCPSRRRTAPTAPLSVITKTMYRMPRPAQRNSMETSFRVAAGGKRDGESISGPVGESDDHL
jgi:hypothetical protein